MPIEVPVGDRGRNLEQTQPLAPNQPSSGSSIRSANATDGRETAVFSQPPFLSLKEAADWLCVSLSTLKRMVAKGELSTVRVGARRKISASALSAYVAKDIVLPSEVDDNGINPI